MDSRKLTLSLLILPIAFGAFLWNQNQASRANAQKSPTGNLTGIQKEILHLEEEGQQAEIKGNTSLLEKRMADDIIISLGGGQRWTKAQYLDSIKKAQEAERKARSEGKSEEQKPAQLADVEIHVYGNTAIFHCLATFTERDDSGKEMKYTYRDTDVWVKLNGQWKQTVGTAVPVRMPDSPKSNP